MSQEEKHRNTYLHGANLAAGLSPDCQSGALLNTARGQAQAVRRIVNE